MESSADSDKTTAATTTNTLQVPQMLPPQKNRAIEKNFLQVPQNDQTKENL